MDFASPYKQSLEALEEPSRVEIVSESDTLAETINQILRTPRRLWNADAFHLSNRLQARLDRVLQPHQVHLTFIDRSGAAVEGQEVAAML